MKIKINKKNKEYDICKEACIEAGCFLPEDTVFYSSVANTPMYLRVYFTKKGILEEYKKIKLLLDNYNTK